MTPGVRRAKTVKHQRKIFQCLIECKALVDEMRNVVYDSDCNWEMSPEEKTLNLDHDEVLEDMEHLLQVVHNMYSRFLFRKF